MEEWVYTVTMVLSRLMPLLCVCVIRVHDLNCGGARNIHLLNSYAVRQIIHGVRYINMLLGVYIIHRYVEVYMSQCV